MSQMSFACAAEFGAEAVGEGLDVAGVDLDTGEADWGRAAGEKDDAVFPAGLEVAVLGGPVVGGAAVDGNADRTHETSEVDLG
jgi:glucose dehydrogenase